MAIFDLERFRELAFGGSALPDHPLRTVADATAAIAELPAGDPHAALADLTALAKTMNETDSFSAGRRARILCALDEAARDLWRELGAEYLAPGGRPLHADGDVNILRAFFDSASEFADGFAIALDAAGESKSSWVKANLARIHLRNMRWLAKRLALAHMLRSPVISAIWERIHRLHRLAEEQGLARLAQPVFEGNRYPSSVRQEYVRCLLLELASPQSMPGRQVELAFRVAGRVASAAHLDADRSTSTAFAVVPWGDSRPVLVQRVGPNVAPAPLYLDATLCLPKLRAARERDMGRDPSEPDTLYGGEFTLGERLAMIDRLLEHWGMDAPQRHARRVAMASPARVVGGFEQVVKVLPALVPGELAVKRRDLQLELDETSRGLLRERLRAAVRAGAARVIDASTGGLGVALRRQDGKWAKHGELVAVRIEPGNAWVVGVVRRIFPVDDELRLGIQVLSTRPRAVSLSAEALTRDCPWEESIRLEATFNEYYKKAIVLDPAPDLGIGDVLLEPGLASRGSQFEVLLPAGPKRMRVARLLHAGDHYQRALCEPLE